MALTPEQTTRVDQLHANLRLIARAHQARAGVPDAAPMFTTHADGSVWNRQGVQIRGPRPT
jgi:hypothetical protein